jgi:hypothetical protein
MLRRVDLRERSNMRKMVTASLQTRGSMLMNSRCPPRSQMLKVISVFLRVIVFSMKLTPARQHEEGEGERGTECLDIIFIEFVLDILHH